MPLGTFPILKIGTLLIRHISRPLVNKILDHTKTHPIFRNYIIIPPAQFYHWCEIKLKMWVLNLGKAGEIPKMNEARAIELGSNLLGEFLIFGTALSLLLNEYMRSLRKEAAKERARKNEIVLLQETIQQLKLQTEEQTQIINKLIESIHLELFEKNKNPSASKTYQSSVDYPIGSPPRQDNPVEGDE